MEKKTKIMFVHHGTGIGGAAISLLQMVLKLNKSKFQPITIFMEDSSARDFFLENQVNVDEILNLAAFSHTVIWWYSLRRIHHFFKAFWSTIRLFFIFGNILKKYEPNIVHLNSSPLWAITILCHFYKIPVICHIREPLAPGYFGIRKYLIAKIVSFFSTEILAICKNDGKPWKKSPKLKILYNAVDENRFTSERKKKNSDKVIFLFVGGFSEEKGISFLLDTWEKVLEKKANLKAQLWIAGNCEDTKKAQSWKNIISPQARFFKKINEKINQLKKIKVIGLQKDLLPIFLQTDVLLFPCQVGHFARPVIEAAKLKITSIATNTSPLDELIIHKKTGLLINIDTDLWSEQIIQLTKSPKFKHQLGLKAEKLANKKFLLTNQIIKLEKIYQKSLINHTSSKHFS